VSAFVLSLSLGPRPGSPGGCVRFPSLLLRRPRGIRVVGRPRSTCCRSSADEDPSQREIAARRHSKSVTSGVSLVSQTTSSDHMNFPLTGRPSNRERPTLVLARDQRPKRDDLGRRLSEAGYEVVPVVSAGAVLSYAVTQRLDGVVLDVALPDFSGYAALRALTLLGRSFRAVIIDRRAGQRIEPSEFSGKVACLEPSVGPTTLLATVEAVMSAPLATATLSPHPSADIAHRWARLVLHGCAANVDIRTMSIWANRVAVSASGLREVCRILRISPRNARDLTRLLAAVCRAHQCNATIAAVLDVSDRRTLCRLLHEGGVISQGRLPTVEQLLRRQRWVSGGNPGLRVLQRVFQSSELDRAG
jgi:CheY-like chemotaxis protein